MAKLTSLIEQRQNPGFSEKGISDAKQIIADDLKNSNLNEIISEYNRLKKNAFICWGITLIPVIVAIIMLFIRASNIVLIIFAVLAAVGVAISFMAGRKAANQKKLWKRTIVDAVDQNKVIKTLVESKYENTKVLLDDHASNSNVASAYRSKDIPSDAKIHRTFKGLSMSINNHMVYTSRVTWHWVRKYCNGKTCTYQHYYKDNFYMYSGDTVDRFDGFTFSMARSGIFSNKGKELENDMFNKKFSYVHNDPLKLRILLTPLIQETFVNEFNSFVESDSTCFVKERRGYTLYKTLTRTPFTIDTNMRVDLDQTIDGILNDSIEDARYLLDNLSFIATFRELIK